MLSTRPMMVELSPVPLRGSRRIRTAAFAPVYRPVTVVDASAQKRLDLRVEVPVEDMASLDDFEPLPSGPASQGPKRKSIWSAIHPKLLELVRSHRSTLIFVNSRRLAERISGAINELAGEDLVRAHHGSVAVAQRKEIEDRLKLGTLRGIVATSSLELGIDMGAVDLVIQVESPPSVASGMQRVGRASHRVGAVSNAIVFPKYRADLIACAAITRSHGTKAKLSQSTTLEIRWTCSRSKSLQLLQWIIGRLTNFSIWFAQRLPMLRSRALFSKPSWTCSLVVIRRMSSQNFGRVSRGIV